MHKKRLLNALKNGMDFFGMTTLEIPGLNTTGRKENKARNHIQRLCREFEECIDRLLKVRSVE